MSKDTLKNIIDLIDEKDDLTIYNVLVRFIPEDKPLPDEIEALKLVNIDIAENGTVPLSSVDWD
jgi:hypothetical protein